MSNTAAAAANAFVNPYDTKTLAALGDTNHRTTINIAKRDYAFLQGVHGSEGTLQTTINILFNALVNHMVSTGITEYDPAKYERTVIDAANRICPGAATSERRLLNLTQRSPVIIPQPQGQALAGDVGRGTPPVARAPQGVDIQPSNARAGGKRRRTATSK